MRQSKVKSYRTGPWIFLSFFFIILLHMPIVFAAGMAKGQVLSFALFDGPPVTEYVPASTDKILEAHEIDDAYQDMGLGTMGLSETAFTYAIQGFNKLVRQGELAREDIISIVDFSLPSSSKRLFVIDLEKMEVLFHTYVSHGVNSGKKYANSFSNKPMSYQSSLGFYETLNTYSGKNGYSLKLQGLENGINDNAARRAIVIHGAAYANETALKTQGYLGRSWGCPALPEKVHRPIIDKIKEGTCLFIYSPDNSYLKKSRIFNA